MAEYRLSPAAERDLESIWIYTRNIWGDDQAARYINLLTDAFATLARSPETTPACDHIRRGYRRAHIENHLVYFRLASKGIDVIRVLHERMDVRRHL